LCFRGASSIQSFSNAPRSSLAQSVTAVAQARLGVRWSPGRSGYNALVIRIRPARPDEAAALTGLVLRSKAHWGYGEDFLALCREELALRPEELETLRAHVAERDGGPLLGVFTIRGAPPDGILEHLYVEPSAMGLGVGRMLLRAAREIARSSGFSALLIHSDPNAEAFYLREGAVRAGSVPSGSIPGRMLPLLRLEL